MLGWLYLRYGWAGPAILVGSIAVGRGIASALLASMVALARQRGLPAVATFAGLTSRPVFEWHGFVIAGERYFGEGDGAAMTYEMRCVLDGTTPL